MFTDLFRKPKFATVSTRDDEDRETLLDSPTPKPLETRTGAQRSRDLKIAIRTVLLSTAVYVSVGLGLALSVRTETIVLDPDEFCINHVSQYSPVVKEVKPGWRTVQFNGSFLHENIYRQAAGPEVDTAWEALGTDYRSVVIPLEEAERTGLRSDQVKVSQVYGGGYPANVEGLHHLHCLWNYAYYQKEGKGAFQNSEYIVRYHVTHCMDILRQQLMCVTDVGVLGQVWWQPKDEPNPQPFVDFNTKHRCRDFDAIRKWAQAHQVPPGEEVDMSIFYQMPKLGDTIYPEIP